MMDKIIQYFVSEKKVSPTVAKVLSKTIMKYPDIRDEFICWIDNRNYDFPGTIEVNGYSAQSIHKLAPHLDAAGVYNFMVTLRDDPAKAQGYIQSGFPRK